MSLTNNTLITPDVIAKASLAELFNASVLLKKVDRQFDKEVNGKVGGKARVRRPIKLQAVVGPDITGKLNDVVSGYDTIELTTQLSVPLSFTAQELTLEVTEFSNRILKPAMVELAQQIELAIGESYSDIWNFCGTPGTLPASLKEIAANQVKMDEMGVPHGDRSAFLSSDAVLELADSLQSVFPGELAKTAIQEATVARYAGFEIFKAPASLPLHTVGDYTGSTILIKGAGQAVAYEAVKDSNEQTLAMDGFAANRTGALKKGDVLEIDGVYAVNPRSRKTTGKLAQFVVKQDVNSDGTGNAGVVVSPAIITSGPFQTVVAEAADNAGVTVITGQPNAVHKQNLTWAKQAVTAVFAPLEMLPGLKGARHTYENISLRFMADGDIMSDNAVYRIDVLFGVKALNPQFATRHTE